jgi:[ribosomal protein S5]-alanine N-acetyltransferase
MAELRDIFPNLETERLLLRQMRPTDAEAIFQIFSDDEVTRYYDLATFTSLEQAQRLIARINERFEREEGLRWGIVRKDSGRLIGTGGYNGWVRSSHRASIGYDLARSAWGQGFMPEALQAILEYGFETLNLYRVEALVVPGNLQSMHVLHKLGFQEEGRRRSYGYWKNQFWDLHCFSLLKSDRSL